MPQNTDKNMHEELVDETASPAEEAEAPANQDCHCEEYLAGWKRAQADYANLKKENDREKLEFAKYANEKLINDLLPAIDQFESALAHAPDLRSLADDQAKRIQNWINGIVAVKNLWESVFKDIGLERVPTEGSFDPLVHEAVGHVDSAELEEGSVAKVMRSGWRLNGKLLRPAQVMVAKRTSS
jgi:molecular chaperone GrpE